MTVLAILQNMWVKDPEKVKAMIARTPAVRRRLIVYSLFAGCRTGRVLKQIFGDDCPRRFVWEESTTEIAGNPRDTFPPDMEHLRRVLDEVKPDVVIAFGRIAGNALAQIVPGDKLVLAPHPTARQRDTLQRLKWAAEAVDNMTRPSAMAER